MTRNEAKKHFSYMYEDGFCKDDLMVGLDQIYNDHEAQLKAKDKKIAELEEAMKPKACDGCKQSWEPNNQTFHKYFCEYLKIPVHGGFYCNRYEPKDNE